MVTPESRDNPTNLSQSSSDLHSGIAGELWPNPWASLFNAIGSGPGRLQALISRKQT